MNPGAPPTAPPPTAPTDAVSKAASQVASAAALRSLDAKIAAEKRPPAAPNSVNVNDVRRDPAYAQASSAWQQHPEDYASQRAQGMRDWGASNPPSVNVIVHEVHPNYGAYDGAYLAAAFVRAATDAAYANWLYSHRRDPWYQSAHDDMIRAAQQNADLREQLARTDARVADLQRQNAQLMAANALPPGVNAAVAIAPEVVRTDVAAYAQSAPPPQVLASPVAAPAPVVSATPAVRAQAVTPPAQQSSGHGLLWTVIIVVLIAGAVAVYFLVIRKR